MRASRSSLALALALVLALAGGACKRRQPAAPPPPPRPVPTLGPVTVEDLTPEPDRPGGRKLDEAALAAEVRQTLAASGLFRTASADSEAPVSARVRIEVGLEDVQVADRGAARAAVRLRIDTRPSDVAERRFNEDVQAGAESEYRVTSAGSPSPEERRALFQKLASRTLKDLLAGYLARQRLWSGDPGAVRQVLQGDAGELTIEAIRAVGERKLSSEAPRLLQLLDHPEEPIRDAALGALVELRERRAVAVLAEQRSMRDKREMRKILDAIALLGGNEAADYLAFVADGHEDPEIRTLAKEARARLQRRGGAK